MKIKNPPSQPAATTVTFGKAAEQAPTTGPIAEVAKSKGAQQLSSFVAKQGTTMTVDFGTSPVGADAAARLFSELLKSDATDVVGLTQYLSALGVQVGYQGTPISNFTGMTHKLAKVPFPSEPAPHLLDAFKKVQELSAATKKLAIGLQKDEGPQNLRSSKKEAVFVAHQLLEIWKRAPSQKDGEPLAAAALQALKNCAELQGRIQFAMQDFVENTKKGMGLPTEGPQPLLDPELGDLIFRNTLRSGVIEDPAARQQHLDEKYAKFLKKGGTANSVERVSPQFLANVPNGARAEFVLVREKDKSEHLNVSLDMNAGHSVIAGVDPTVKMADADRKLEDKVGITAGGFRFARADDGRVLIFGDCKSGHYRAPVQTLDALTDHLVAGGMPRENIVLTAGDPLDTGEVLAIDVWVYKAANNNTLPKDVGDKMFSDSVALYDEALAKGVAVAESLFGKAGGAS
jgi:hypothetical protein